MFDELTVHGMRVMKLLTRMAMGEYQGAARLLFALGRLLIVAS